MGTNLRGLATRFYLGSTAATASSCQDCSLTAQVIDISTSVQTEKLESLTVNVLTLSTSSDQTCPYAVGDTIVITKFDFVKPEISRIKRGLDLKLQYRTFSAMGENGSAIERDIWRVEGFIERCLGSNSTLSRGIYNDDDAN